MARCVASWLVMALVGLSTAAAQQPDREYRGPADRGAADRGPAGRPPMRSRVGAAAEPSRPSQPAEPGSAAPSAGRPRAAALQVEPLPVVPSKLGAGQHQRVVVRLSNAPASDLAATLHQLLSSEGRLSPGKGGPSIVIVPEPITNSLVLGGPSEAIAEVRKLVAELDRAKPMVRVEVVLIEAPAGELKGAAAGRAGPDAPPDAGSVVGRAELLVLDQQPGQFQFGLQQATITGTAQTAFGQTNSIQYQNVGTIVKLTPRVGPDDAVTLEIEVNHSHLGRSEEGTPIAVSKEGETIRTPVIASISTQTRLRVPDGQTVVVSGQTPQSPPSKQMVMRITPHVVRLSPQR